SRRYTNSLSVRGSLTIRAIAYDSDFSQSWEADPMEVVIIPAFLLDGTTHGGGALTVSPTNSPYLSNTLVTITPAPAPGWTFLQWLGDVSGTNATNTVVMTRDKCVEAVFGTSLGTAVSVGG